jgi:hypothetical protein
MLANRIADRYREAIPTADAEGAAPASRTHRVQP